MVRAREKEDKTNQARESDRATREPHNGTKKPDRATRETYNEAKKSGRATRESRTTKQREPDRGARELNTH